MEPDPTHQGDLAGLAETRARVARSRFARSMFTPWRLAMWTVGLATLGAVSVGVYLLASGGSAVALLALFGGALVAFTALGMVAILYPGERAELDQELARGSTELEGRVTGMKRRLDLATSKGNRDRGPYGAGGDALEPSAVDATREEVQASLDEIERARTRAR